MIDLSRILPNGSIDQGLIFATLLIAHILLAASLTAFYLVRSTRRHRRAEIIRDTIDALLDEHFTTEAPASKTRKINVVENELRTISTIDMFNQLTKDELIEYLSNYFKAASYNSIKPPDSASEQVSPHLIIERSSRKGVVLIDQPSTGITGQSTVKRYYDKNSHQLKPADSLIIITTGSLSPKAIEFCQSRERPIIVVTGQQLAISIKQVDSKNNS